MLSGYLERRIPSDQQTVTLERKDTLTLDSGENNRVVACVGSISLLFTRFWQGELKPMGADQYWDGIAGVRVEPAKQEDSGLWTPSGPVVARFQHPTGLKHDSESTKVNRLTISRGHEEHIDPSWDNEKQQQWERAMRPKLVIESQVPLADSVEVAGLVDLMSQVAADASINFLTHVDFNYSPDHQLVFAAKSPNATPMHVIDAPQPA